MLGLYRQFGGRLFYLVGALSGFLGHLAYPGDVGGNILGAGRRLFDIAGDFLGRRALFLDRRSNTGSDLIDLANDPRAASMVALRAKRLVWLAISLISSTTSPILVAARPGP